MLNEEKHIERVVSGFLGSQYSNLVEILVADGGSTDKTREIVKALSQKDKRVKLLGNPEKFQSFGLNKMIEFAQGEVFLRADGHCFYSEDYIEKCIKVILNTGAKNVGGAQRYKASNYVQAGTALAVKSFLGNGGANYMQEDYEGYSDTVFLGCFWTRDLQKLNGFNTENITNEDAELNYRIVEELKGNIYISPQVKLWYLPRDSFYKLFKQYMKYGRGRFLTGITHSGGIPFRSKAPFIFIGIMLLFLVIDIVVLDGLLGSLYFFGAVLIIFILESIRISFKKKEYFLKNIWKNDSSKAPNSIILGFFTLISLLIMHVSHFSGYGYQFLKMKVFRKKGW